MPECADSVRTPKSTRRIGGCSKRPVQHGRRPVGARSVYGVCERANGSRTRLAGFCNSPTHESAVTYYARPSACRRHPTGKVQYVVQDFLLAFHGKAKSAAIAARCAGAQGEYRTMSHELFVNQRQLGTELYESLATGQGLNLSQFATCLDDPAVAKAVDDDMAYGQSVNRNRGQIFG